MSSEQLESFMPPRERLVFWLRRLYKHRLTTTTGGNISLIDDDGVLYITPSGGDKAHVHPSNVATCKSGSNIFEGIRAPSMEWKLHTLAYSVRPDCKAVLHAHSMALIAYSLAALDRNAISSHCMQTENPGVPGEYYPDTINAVNCSTYLNFILIISIFRPTTSSLLLCETTMQIQDASCLLG